MEETLQNTWDLIPSTNKLKQIKKVSENGTPPLTYNAEKTL